MNYIARVFERLRHALRILASPPINIASVQGRTHQRYRLAAFNALANGISAAMGMLSVLVTTPMTLHALGTDRFGVWMAVAGFAGMLSFTDLGVGNALVNLIAAAKAQQGSSDRAAQVARRGLATLTLMGIAIGCVMLTAIWLYPIDGLISRNGTVSALEVHDAVVAFSLCFALSLPMTGAQRLLFGMQKGWLVHFCRIAALALSVFLVWLITQEQPTISHLLYATYGIQTLASLTLLPFIVRECRSLRGVTAASAAAVPLRQDFKNLFGTGSLYLCLQAGVAIGWGSDAFIAAATLGTLAVTQLSIVQRLFQFVTIPLAIINGPLWAAYADANARGDRCFIELTLRRSTSATAAIAVVLSCCLLAGGNLAISLWLGEPHRVPFPLLAAFAVWTVIEAVGNSLAMYLNGCGIIKPQVLVVVLFCLLVVPLKLFLPSHLGVAGIVLATVTAYILCVVLPYSTFLRPAVFSALRPQH